MHDGEPISLSALRRDGFDSQLSAGGELLHDGVDAAPVDGPHPFDADHERDVALQRWGPVPLAVEVGQESPTCTDM